MKYRVVQGNLGYIGHNRLPLGFKSRTCHSNKSPFSAFPEVSSALRSLRSIQRDPSGPKQVWRLSEAGLPRCSGDLPGFFTLQFGRVDLFQKRRSSSYGQHYVHFSITIPIHSWRIIIFIFLQLEDQKRWFHASKSFWCSLLLVVWVGEPNLNAHRPGSVVPSTIASFAKL